MTTHIMIDIETLSLDQNAAILAIGAVSFRDPNWVTPKYTERSSFVRYLDVTQCLDHGMVIDDDTVRWWLKDKGRRAVLITLLQGEDSLKASLKDLCTFIHLYTEPLVWSNGTNFDISRLERLYYDMGLRVPWAYNAIRDYRTLRNTFRERVEEVEDTTELHNPLNDARHQARHLHKILSYINEVPQ